MNTILLKAITSKYQSKKNSAHNKQTFSDMIRNIVLWEDSGQMASIWTLNSDKKKVTKMKFLFTSSLLFQAFK